MYHHHNLQFDNHCRRDNVKFSHANTTKKVIFARRITLDIQSNFRAKLFFFSVNSKSIMKMVEMWEREKKKKVKILKLIVLCGLDFEFSHSVPYSLLSAFYLLMFWNWTKLNSRLYGWVAMYSLIKSVYNLSMHILHKW